MTESPPPYSTNEINQLDGLGADWAWRDESKRAMPYGYYLGEGEIGEPGWETAISDRIADLEAKVERLERAIEVLTTVGGDRRTARAYLREES